MRKMKTRKLALSKTTVRALSADKLDGIAGGSGMIFCQGNVPGLGVPVSFAICGGVPGGTTVNGRPPPNSGKPGCITVGGMGNLCTPTMPPQCQG